MNGSTQVEATKPAVREIETTSHNKVSAAAFVNSVPFAGESSSVQIGRNCDSITPARLEADGTAVAIDKGQRADGLLVRKKVHNLNTHERFVDQVFVPFANVRGVQYGK